MEFSHRRVIKACANNADPAAFKKILDDPVAFKKIYRRLVRGHKVPIDFPNFLKLFLTNLPPAKKMRKVIRRLREMTKMFGFKIRYFRWWDVVHKERTLLAVVRRNGHEIHVRFCWKQAGKRDLFPAAGVFNGCVRRIPVREGPWQIMFEDTTYARVKAQYARFLRTPIAILLDPNSI